jgi:FAD:protein FMN transferase
LYRQFITLILLTAFYFSSFAQPSRFVFTEAKMGSPFTIILYHQDSAYAKKVSQAAFMMVDSLVNIYSNYIDSSELNHLSATAGGGSSFRLSAALFDILQQAEKAYKRSHHAFDITVGPLTDLWRKARKEKKFPEDALVQKTRALTGFRYLKINSRQKTAKLRKKGMRLDLGGIAQGYIAGKVLAYIQNASIKSVLVDVSGDIALGDPPPGKKGWILGVNLPGNADALQDKKITASNLTVSTSGDVYQYILHDGKKYSHIVDPRTGYGVTEGKNVTVIAADAVTADWLATACSILSTQKAKKLARKMKAEVMLAWIEKGALKVDLTDGFRKYWQ